MTEDYPGNDKSPNDPKHENETIDAAGLFKEFDDFFVAFDPPPRVIDLDHPPVSQDRSLTIDGELLSILTAAYGIQPPLCIEVARGTDEDPHGSGVIERVVVGFVYKEKVDIFTLTVDSGATSLEKQSSPTTIKGDGPARQIILLDERRIVEVQEEVSDTDREERLFDDIFGDKKATPNEKDLEMLHEIAMHLHTMVGPSS